MDMDHKVRPINYSFSAVGGNTVGFASAVTGSNWVLTNNTVPDGLGHRVVIRNNSATDFSSLTALIAGLDSDGNNQSETVSLPGPSVTTTSVFYYKYIESVVPSSTIGNATMRIGWGPFSLSKTICLDGRANSESGFSLSVSGTTFYSIQKTHGNIFDGNSQLLKWFIMDGFSGLSSSISGSIPIDAQAIRILISLGLSNPSFDLYLFQPNGYGS